MLQLTLEWCLQLQRGIFQQPHVQATAAMALWPSCRMLWEQKVPFPCCKSPFSDPGGSELLARSSSPCSMGLQVFQKSLCSRELCWGSAGVWSQWCSQGAFVCIIIPSSGVGLPYFASHKNSPEIRFDLFPATEITVSCLLPCSSQVVVGGILK